MRKVLFFTLLLFVLAVGLLHFFTPGYLLLYHNIYRRLSYFPIVLGAIWFGLPGGFLLALLSSIAFIPHVLLYIGYGPEAYLSELMEIVLYLAAGSVVGVISGRQMKLREQYRELSEKLQKSYTRLHEETEQLIEAEEQLAEAQKFSALGQLSASLAHEIKNPLSSIKGTAEILLDDYPEGHPKREFVDILLKETARLNQTVEDVLRFSRGKKGKAAQTEPLSEVVKRVSTLLDRHLRGKEISLQLKGLDLAKDFLIDGSRISQVFLNILLNAIDAVARQGKIRIEVMKTAGGYTVEVSDNGPGIPETEREKIFEPFVSGKEGGTGLGLVITRKIVTSYGGTITLEKSDLGGACFRIFLPGNDRASYSEDVGRVSQAQPDLRAED